MNETDLAVWLLEQIAEDERKASDASPLDAVTDHVWKTVEVEERGPGVAKIMVRMVVTRTREALVARLGMDREQRASNHITRWDPRRVLAECEAKRKILAAYLPPGGDPHPGQPCVNYKGQRPEDYDEFDTCARHIAASENLIHHDYVLRLLALPYADRPGYRAEWRP